MERRQHDPTNERPSCIALGLWIATGTTVAWWTLWFLSGDFSGSLFAVLLPMALLAWRLREPGRVKHTRATLLTAPRRIRVSFDSSRANSIPE